MRRRPKKLLSFFGESAVSSYFSHKRLVSTKRLAIFVVLALSIAVAAGLIANESFSMDPNRFDRGNSTSLRAGAETPAQRIEQCRSYQVPSSGLDWPTSGVWSQGRLILADALARSLVIFNPEEQQFETHRSLKNGLSETNEALSEIRSIPDGSGDYLVEDEAGPEGDHLVRVDSELNPTDSRLDIEGRNLGNGTILDVIYDWQPTSIEGVLGVLAFADFQRGDDWKSGLVFFDEQNNASILREWSIHEDFVFQNTQETGYISVVGQQGFMLVWESEPYLLQVDLTSDGLREKEPQKLNVPSDLRSRAPLKAHRDWKFMTRPAEQMMLHYQIAESTPGTSSIFSLGSQLFLISRESISRNGVNWTLSELSIADGSELGRAPLPVSKQTRHLTVSVGDDAVAFLQKGKAENIAAEGWVAPYLPIQGLKVIPVSSIKGLKTGSLQNAGDCS